MPNGSVLFFALIFLYIISMLCVITMMSDIQNIQILNNFDKKRLAFQDAENRSMLQSKQ